MPLPRSTRTSPGCDAGGQLELGRAVERLDGHGRAERRLDDRQVDLRVDVVALAHEARVRVDAHEHVDVARAAAERAGMTLAGDADALPVVDAGRDVDVERPRLRDAPRATALLARVLDDLAAAAAVRARLRADELAEDAARDLMQAAAPLAARAGARLRARLDAVAAADLARRRDLERHLHLRPSRRLDELDLDLRADVRAALLRAPRAPPPKTSSPKNAEKRSLRPPTSKCVGVKPPERSPACP